MNGTTSIFSRYTNCLITIIAGNEVEDSFLEVCIYSLPVIQTQVEKLKSL